MYQIDQHISYTQGDQPPYRLLPAVYRGRSQSGKTHRIEIETPGGVIVRYARNLLRLSARQEEMFS